MREIKRTVQSLLNLKNGEQPEADEILSAPLQRESEIFQLRTSIEKEIRQGNPSIVCLYCKQPVALRGKKNRDLSSTFYFTHLYKSHDCIFKTSHKLTEEQIRCIKYNGQKESDLHQELKGRIAFYLKLDPTFSNVQEERVIKEEAISGKWRKPDVSAEYLGHRIAFELQLSTTFLSVIVERSLFYYQNGISLIWIFPSFNLDTDLQKFTQKDVYYNNNFNVFVFDRDAMNASDIEQTLILKCFYKRFYVSNGTVKEKWDSSLIKINFLNFKANRDGVWFYDSATEKSKCELEIAEQLAQKKRDAEAERKKRLMETAVQYVREYFRQNGEPYTFEYDPLEDIESEEDITELNNLLAFDDKNARFIAEQLLDRRKYNFIDYVFYHPKIRLNFSAVRFESNRTLFAEVVRIDNIESFAIRITLLFASGYKLLDEDILIYENLYSKNYANSSDYERDAIERWATIYCLLRCKSKLQISNVYKLRKVLFPILSLKEEMVIGQKFSTIKQVVMNFLEFHKLYTEIFITSMKAFGYFEKMKEDDKKGKFLNKIQAFEREKKELVPDHVSLFLDIFPELKEFYKTNAPMQF